MSPLLARWLGSLGVPAGLVPGYWSLALLAAWLGAFLFLRLVERDGADRRQQGYALIAVYVGALGGGYVLEWLRALPTAIATGSLTPVLESGRAAYGGLLGGWLLAGLYLRAQGEPLAPFYDRSVTLLAPAFILVRLGCFLAGCDYGRVTTGPWGLRFPSGSPAALAHAAAGWVPADGASLPVHPTQLYEVGLAGLATLLALPALLRGPRDGRAFRRWILCYAAGRFLLEFLRADGARGLYLGLSTAQWLSIAIGVALLLPILWRQRSAPTEAATRGLAVARPLATSLMLAVLLLPTLSLAKSKKGKASAKSDETPAATAVETPGQTASAAAPAPNSAATASQGSAGTTSPTATGAPAASTDPKTVVVVVQPGQTVQIVTAPAPGTPASTATVVVPGQAAGPATSPASSLTAEPAPSAQVQLNSRRFGLRVTFGGMLPISRPEILAGGTFAIDGTYRIRLSENHRFEAGLELRGWRASDSGQFALSVPLRAFFGLARHFELGVGFSPGYAHIWFDSSSFRSGADAFLAQLEFAMQFPLTSRMTIGFTPAAISILGGGDVRTFVGFEPRLWLGVSFL